MSHYVEVAIKLTLGFFCLIVFMNLSGKGNLAPLSSADQIQNYVLGGILGGIIYSPHIISIIHSHCKSLFIAC
jgi:uncharacterized membrane protein YcaP (DUF421 family)